MRRRTFVTAAVLGGLTVATADPAAAAPGGAGPTVVPGAPPHTPEPFRAPPGGSAPPGAPVRVELPAPGGPLPVGAVDLHLVDRSRPDPWVPSRPYRELMVTVHYPARDAARYPVRPQMTAGAAADFDATVGVVAPGVVDWAGVAAHSRLGPPLDRRGGARPVVLYSPGFGCPRTLGTLLVEELASRGFVVVTVDHTFEAPQVEFPGGRVERQAWRPEDPIDRAWTLAVRVADTRFVLDELTRLDRRHALPGRLAGGLDLSRVGMFGHSLGGATAGQVMLEDRRVDAGANLDGAFSDDVAARGLPRPMLMLASETHTQDTDPTWRGFRQRQRGWVRELRFTGAEHYSFTDLEAMVPQFADVMRVPAAEFIGTIDPGRAMAAERAYLAAYFDRHLRRGDGRLFDGPSPRYPEVAFI